MDKSSLNRKLIGAVGVIFGLLTLISLLVIDRNKFIIPVSDIFIIKYSIIISIINGGLWFTIFGILILTEALPNPADAKNEIEYRQIRAKGFLLGTLSASPFFISFFATILVLSTSNLWKILGGGALVYVAWSVYSNVRILMSKRK